MEKQPNKLNNGTCDFCNHNEAFKTDGKGNSICESRANTGVCDTVTNGKNRRQRREEEKIKKKVYNKYGLKYKK